jgi:acyl carrier protein
MDKADILSGVTEVIRDVLDLPDLVVGMDTTAEQTEGWDSVNHISIVVGCEMKFKVKFKTAEIESLRHVGDLVDLIDSKLNR